MCLHHFCIVVMIVFFLATYDPINAQEDVDYYRTFTDGFSAEKSGELVNIFAGVCDNSDPLISFRRYALREGTLIGNLSEIKHYWIQRQAFAINTHTYTTFITGLKRYHGRTGALVYAHDRQKLCIWLINDSGIIAYHRIRVTYGELFEAILDYRFAIALHNRTSARSPTLKGKKSSIDIAVYPRGRRYVDASRTMELMPETALSQYESKLRALLLPPLIATKLSDFDNLTRQL